MTRTVKVDLVAGTGGYTAPMEKASATTLKLALANQEQAASAKEAAAATVKASEQIAIATKQAAVAAAQSAAQTAAGDEAQLVAKKAVEAATKELAAQEKASAKAVAAAERDSAAAAREVVAAQKAIEAQTKATAEAYSNTGKRLMTAGAVMTGAFAIVEKATNSFDVALSGVEAHADNTPQQLKQLADAALTAGEATAYTATQAAGAEDELEKAGVSTADILGGALTGSMSLAAAGTLDLAKSADIASDTMNTFKLKGKDVGHIADVLASGANASSADVGELSDALSQTGLVADQMGLSLEDTTGTLAAFAQNGLHGADAGTSLKTMIERLAAPTGAAADTMKNLGIQVYDAKGSFVGITSVAGQLHDKLGPLTAAQRNLALQTIFGSDAIRGATVLYGLGAQGLQNWIDQTDQSGAAQEMAAKQTNNLSGDLKKLQGSLDAALIQSGGGANNVLRDLTQNVTSAVNVFASLPKPVQEAATAVAGAGGSMLLLVGGATTAAGKVGALRKGLKEAEETADGFKGGMAKAGSFLTGPWGMAIAAGTALAVVFGSKMHAAKVDVTDFTDSLKEDGTALGSHTQAAVAADLANRGVYDSYAKLGVSMGTVTQAALGNADAMKAVADATSAAMKSGSAGDMAALGKNLNIILATANGLHEQQRAQLQVTAATEGGAAASADDEVAQLQQAQASQDAAVAKLRQAAAARAAADAANAEKTSTTASTTATKSSTTAHGASTTATKADESATKAATKAADAAAKAKTADAKASASAANAADKGSYANSTAAGAAKSAAQATRDATAAKNADATASRTSETAAKDAARAHDANATAARGSADAASSDAQAQAQAAEAAREAALDHQIGAEALQGWAKAAAGASGGTETLSGDVADEVSAMKDAKDAANDLRDALDALNGIHITAGRAAIDVQTKIAALTKSFAENGKTLDISTEAGRANMSAILDLTEAMNGQATAVAEETKNVGAGNATLDASRVAFDKVLKSVGLTTGQIDNFNQTLAATPETVPVTVTVNDADALKRLADLKAYEDRIGFVHIAGTTGHVGMAAGGRVVGPGTPTSDSISARLSRDEYVIKASAAQRIGYAELDRINFGGGARTLVKAPMLGSAGGATPHPAAAAVTRSLQLTVAPGADSGVATFMNYLIRNKLIDIG